MSRASLSSTLRRVSALLVLGAAGLGCGGLGPGDYVFYRVAFSQQQKKSPGCFIENSVPADEKFDKTSFRASSLFLIYGATEEQENKLYLDMGAVMVDDDGMAGDDEGRAITVEGYEEAGLFTFTGSSTDVDFTEINGGGDKHTTTTKVLVELTMDGSSMVGSVEATRKQSCSGSTCDLTLPDPRSCTTTSTFVGTEIDDVELHHTVD
ncbi:MAG TPA: hypothetical protein VE093_12030 [Polyangiaceae bacterium]|jgi:hypothetical protein|nr:hypothetical protein [Polyangiaceae bacterium]